MQSQLLTLNAILQWIALAVCVVLLLSLTKLIGAISASHGQADHTSASAALKGITVASVETYDVRRQRAEPLSELLGVGRLSWW